MVFKDPEDVEAVSNQLEIDRRLFTYKVNVSIGNTIRKIRKMRNLSQTELAQKIDVSFQQVQKYENGANRISLSALLLIAMALDIPIPILFADIAENFEPLMTSNQERQILTAFRLMGPAESPSSIHNV
jgi:transcriptional regulator with XRE-family HTH domain